MAPRPALLPEMTMHRRKQSMAPSLPNPVDLCRFNKIMAGKIFLHLEPESEPCAGCTIFPFGLFDRLQLVSRTIVVDCCLPVLFLADTTDMPTT